MVAATTNPPDEPPGLLTMPEASAWLRGGETRLWRAPPRVARCHAFGAAGALGAAGRTSKRLLQEISSRTIR